MDGSLYIGVIANTTHIEEVRAWLAYLFSIK
jgi:ABC-type Fe3+ transport system substrate-binding protein